MEYFNIIQALCRCSLANPSSATVHQVERLRDELKKAGSSKEVKALDSLLSAVNKSCDMAPSRIQRSFVMEGQELTPNTPIPVDKESSTPLAEIIFKDELPNQAPLFHVNVTHAIESILNEWKNYDKLFSIQAQPSRSCLIYGAPGTGKTHLAKWIANQIGMPVILARLDGLMSSFLGTSSRNISNLFAFAAKYRCVLLLDEFDAIAKLRDDNQEVGEIKRVVNTLLQNLDARTKIGFTIGITNHENLLDPAIWRRFDVQIEIPKPSSDVMVSILNKFLAPLSLAEEEVKFLSWAIENSSGADAESLVKWLKKSYVLDTNISLVSQIRKFALLNSARIDSMRRTLLSNSDDDLISALTSDTKFSFKQKEVASLLGINASTVSKQLSKINSHGK